jgi:hypothetical protein
MATGEMTWESVSAAVQAHAARSGEWAGAPLPVWGVRLRMEPRHPYRGLDGACLGAPLDGDGDGDDEGGTIVRNEFPCWQRMVRVLVCQDGPSAPVYHLTLPLLEDRLRPALLTIGASMAWDVAAEARAVETLSGLVSPAAMRSYLLTGSFLETSRRSGVKYLFRKLRPTVALSGNGGGVRVLAALCLHPIGYYEGTYAGAMVPTDDVIAHLMLMRGDEHGFWKKANQHPAWSAAAGI